MYPSHEIDSVRMGTSGIYKIQNMENGNVYIGSSTNIRGRWMEHFRKLNKGIHVNVHLQNSWTKHGSDSFFFGTIETVENIDDILIREQWYLDNWNPEYNIAKIAGAPMLGRNHTEESILKMSGKNNHNYGKKSSDETRKKISLAHIGKVFSEKSRKRMSKAKKGKRLSADNISKISGKNNHNYGKSFSDEHKRKISESNSGEKSRFAKLKKEAVLKIRKMYENGEKTQAELGEMFEVSQPTIFCIVNRRTWKNI